MFDWVLNVPLSFLVKLQGSTLGFIEASIQESSGKLYTKISENSQENLCGGINQSLRLDKP